MYSTPLFLIQNGNALGSDTETVMRFADFSRAHVELTFTVTQCITTTYVQPISTATLLVIPPLQHGRILHGSLWTL